MCWSPKNETMVMVMMVMTSDYQFSIRDEYCEKIDKMLRRYDVHLDGKNVAYAMVRPESTEGDGPWLSGLYVKPDHRGQGLATELMRRVENDFEGQVLRGRARPYNDKPVDLETLLEMYRRRGFESYDPDEPSRLKKEL